MSVPSFILIKRFARAHTVNNLSLSHAQQVDTEHSRYAKYLQKYWLKIIKERIKKNIMPAVATVTPLSTLNIDKTDTSSSSTGIKLYILSFHVIFFCAYIMFNLCHPHMYILR